jgi:hypothetical protein
VFGVENLLGSTALIVWMELERVNEEPAGNAEQEGCTIHIHRGEALSPIG